MSVITASNVIVILAIAYQVYRKETALRKIFWPALLLKLAAGVVLGWLYFSYYKEGDTIAFFTDALRIAGLAKSNFSEYLSFLWNSEVDPQFLSTLGLQQPRALFMTKVGSFFCLLSGGNYWIIATWFSLLSFLAAWLLVKVLIVLNPHLYGAAIIGFLFFPSVVFWSSGFIKESLAFAMLCFIAAFFIKAWKRSEVSPSWYVALPVALWVLWNLKYYYLAVLFPVLSTELLFEYTMRQRLEKSSAALKWLIWAGIFIAPLYLISILHPNFNPSVLLDVIVSNHDAFVLLSREGEFIRFINLQPSAGSILVNAPLALLSGMFRPFPWETNGPVALAASLENLLLLSLALYAAYLVVSKNQSFSRGAILILIYSILLCVLLALATPNFGTLSRYRIGFLPFMVMLVCAANPFLQRWTATFRLVQDH